MNVAHVCGSAKHETSCMTAHSLPHLKKKATTRLKQAEKQVGGLPAAACLGRPAPTAALSTG